MTAHARNEPLRIGLTGGIASGKTTVADMFAALGARIIDTDVIARQVVMPGEPALEEIRAVFGAAVFNDDGTLDRAAMRKIVFADSERRRELERILHPRISAETIRQSNQDGGAYQIIVVPLLVDSALRQFVDRILVIDCDERTQIQRLMARDAESEEQARRMLEAQAHQDQRVTIADDVIHNDAGLEYTRAQVQDLHRIYLQLVQSS